MGTEGQDLGGVRAEARAHGLTGEGRQGSEGLTWRRKVMGFCPMAWASPMLARMTSVKGFFTPWAGGGDGENRPHDSRRPLSHATGGNGADCAAHVQPGGRGRGPGHTWRSSCSSSRARSTMGPRTAYSTLRMLEFMVSSVNTFSFTPVIAAWLWSPALKAMTLLRPGRKEAQEVARSGSGRRQLGPGSVARLGRRAQDKRAPSSLQPAGPTERDRKGWRRSWGHQARPTHRGTALPQGATGSG